MAAFRTVLIFVTFSSFCVIDCVCTNNCDAQTRAPRKHSKKSARQKSDDTTVRGRIVQHESRTFKIDLNEMKPVIIEQVKLPEPPVPEDRWPKMKPEEQQKWVRDFETSDRGKKFLADRKLRLENANRFELKVEKNGSFVVYDVPKGTYGFRGRLEKKLAEKTYVFEVFGRIDIEDEVEELLLDPLSVMVTRLVKSDELVPDASIKTFDGKFTIQTQDGKVKIGKKVLGNMNLMVNFWSPKSPPSIERNKLIQELFDTINKEDSIELLSVCVDDNRKKSLEFVVNSEMKGWHGYAKDWEHRIFSEYGVRSIPALFVVGKDGKIKMTPADFMMVLQTQPRDQLSKVVLDCLNGKSVPTPIRTGAAPDPSTEEKN